MLCLPKDDSYDYHDLPTDISINKFHLQADELDISSNVLTHTKYNENSYQFDHLNMTTELQNGQSSLKNSF